MLVISTIQIPTETRVGPACACGRSTKAGASVLRASWIDIAKRNKKRKTNSFHEIATGNWPDSVLEFVQLLELLAGCIRRRDLN